MNYGILDIIVGMTIQMPCAMLASLFSQPILWVVLLIVGMNITMGNFRHVYDKYLNKKLIAKIKYEKQLAKWTADAKDFKKAFPVWNLPESFWLGE